MKRYDSHSQTSDDTSVTAVAVSQRSCWSVVSFWMKVLLFLIFTPAFLNYASLQREGQVLSPTGGVSEVLRMCRLMWLLIFLDTLVYLNVFQFVDAQLIDIGLGQNIHLLCKGHGQPVGRLNAHFDSEPLSVLLKNLMLFLMSNSP